jgi:exonuclease SbcC
MFKSIQLKNFQCHKKLKINFKKLNFLLGNTDTGKTAIIRALQWVIFNKPPRNYINDEADFAVVGLQTDTDIIIRKKSKTENTYHLNGQELKSFGKAPPDVVSKALNINKINFQAQHDSPFWFGETAGEVSKQLNEIVNLEKMDSALSHVTKKLKNKKVELNLIKGRIENLQTKQTELKYILKTEKDFQVIEKITTTQKAKKVRKDTIQNHFKNYKKEIKTKKDLSVIINEGNEILQSAHQLQNHKEKVKNINNLVNLFKVNSTKREIKTEDGWTIIKESENLQKFKEKKNDIAKLIKNYKLQKFDFQNNDKTITQTKKDLKKYMKERCPLCQRKL